MADISDINAAQSVKVIGADTSGVETTPLAVDSIGDVKTRLKGSSLGAAIAQVTPYGYTKVSGEFINLFGDSFDSAGFDTVNRWNTPVISNGGTNSQSLGTLSLATTTTASSQVAISTQPTFTTSVSFLWFGMICIQESPLIIGPHRFWGFGTPNPSYTVTTPLLNAVGFEIDTAGSLNAVIYSSGTKIFSTALTYDPSVPGGYAVATKANVTYFFINDLEVAVATSYLNTPDSYTLPYRQHILNPASTTSGATLFKTQALGLADSSPNQIGISDGLFPWRKITIKPAGQSPLATDTEVLVRASISDSTKATYSASTFNLISAAGGATDIFTITGSSSKVVKVTRIQISATQTSQSTQDIVLLKRSTANSGGTSTSSTIVPHDSNNVAGTATVKAYTVNPTLGTLIGVLRHQKVYIGVVTPNGNSVGTTDRLLFDFAIGPTQAITLRGTSEVLSVNLNGIIIVGSSFDINVEWTEE